MNSHRGSFEWLLERASFLLAIPSLLFFINFILPYFVLEYNMYYIDYILITDFVFFIYINIMTIFLYKFFVLMNILEDYLNNKEKGIKIFKFFMFLLFVFISIIILGPYIYFHFLY